MSSKCRSGHHIVVLDRMILEVSKEPSFSLDGVQAWKYLRSALCLAK
jgi:hypothetical protein